ncbi:hypothetical protein [Nonomuraea cavernae]|uniref:hypothetical protein n=1 Tax=Nonomuraea cavernae TaxID=2045107 RepID=UPI00340CAABC
MNMVASVHNALPVPSKATRAVVVLVVIIVCAYVVGHLAGYGGVVALAAATAMVGVVAERLARVILHRWVRVV